jgi:NAD(P)H dehydrogenase (quinone)
MPRSAVITHELMSNARKPLLVTGAAGNLGRRVVELLLEVDAGPIIATTRTPEKLADVAKRGVEVRRANFNDPATLEQAFAGAQRLLLISTGDLTPEGARLRQHRAAVQAAVDARVQHVVYTSAPAPYPTAAGSLINDHFWTEQALAASPLEWTILRHHLYTEFLLGTLGTALKLGQLTSSIGKVGVNYVTREDCARADAAALAADFSGRRILDVTGPAPITQDELVALASKLTGKPLKHVAVSRTEHAKILAAAGLPPFLIDALLNFQEQGAHGYLAVSPPTVKTLTGKAPTSVQDFLTAHRAALAQS